MNYNNYDEENFYSQNDTEEKMLHMSPQEDDEYEIEYDDGSNQTEDDNREDWDEERTRLENELIDDFFDEDDNSEEEEEEEDDDEYATQEELDALEEDMFPDGVDDDNYPDLSGNN